MKKNFVLIILILINLLIIGLVSAQSTTPNLKVAFIGDQGYGSNAQAVLQLIKNEGAHMVLHQGDFDYNNDPNAWDNQINSILGANFPYFASIGNHDAASWSGYQAKLQARLSRISGATCTGNLGVQSACRYQGLFFLLVAPGEMGSGHDTYIKNQLSGDNSIWSVCSWHKNMKAMQVGGKGDETGWGVYDECLRGGAIVATGHEHSYERTKTLSNTQTQTVDSAWPDPTKLRVAPGATFVFVSGLGGKSIRTQQRCLPTTYPYGCNGEWASIYTSDQGAKYGALFITFNVGGNPNKATGYFKNTAGQTIDSFEITSFLGGGTTTTTVPGTTTTSTTTSTTTTTIPSTTTTTNPSGVKGDLNNDGKVDIIDLGILLSSWGRTDRPPADLNQDGKVDIIDLGILLSNWGKTSSTTTSTSTTTIPSTTTTAPGGWLDQSVCYPEKGPFSLNINNQWLPFPVGMVHVLEGGGLKVQVSVLDQTEVVCGVTTRVVEEREWEGGKLIEVSRNYFVQASDGTVCYYGENVYDGSGNPAGGSWRACVNGARAGIMMPPNPAVGMKWLIEDAQASGAYEDAVVQSIGDTFVTPAGTFTNTLYIIEDFGRSFKRYARGVGMIFDDGILLTKI